MRKQDELSQPESCMSRALDREMTFVLLGRDAAAPVAIEAWIAERIRLGKNSPDDAQIIEAKSCAETMRIEGKGTLILPTQSSTNATDATFIGSSGSSK